MRNAELKTGQGTESPGPDSTVPNSELSGLALLLILAAALALRVLAVASGGFGPADDTPAFVSQAQALLDGRVDEWFYKRPANQRYHKPPVFAALLAGAAVLAGRLGFSLDLGAGAQALALIGGLWMLHPAWLILRRCAGGSAAGARAGALTGLAFLAVMPLTVTMSARQLSDTTYAVIFLYAVNLLLGGLAEARLGRLVGAGALAGLGFLTRSEALTLIPAALLLLAIGALARRLRWRFALVGGAGFLLPALALAVPFVVLLSRAEGRFMIRPNAGQLLLHQAGLEARMVPTSGPAASELEALGRDRGRIAAAAGRHLARYLYSETTRAMGYVGAVFLVAGLVAGRRELFRWGPWQLGVLVYLLGVAQLAVFGPHQRLLLAPIALLAWPMAAGAVALAAGIVRWNPARLAQPQRAFGWLLAGQVAVVAVVTLATILRKSA